MNEFIILIIAIILIFIGIMRIVIQRASKPGPVPVTPMMDKFHLFCGQISRYLNDEEMAFEAEFVEGKNEIENAFMRSIPDLSRVFFSDAKYWVGDGFLIVVPLNAFNGYYNGWNTVFRMALEEAGYKTSNDTRITSGYLPFICAPYTPQRIIDRIGEISMSIGKG